MKNERPIADCLNVLNRDIRLMNMALTKREQPKKLDELFSVLDQIAAQAVSQLVSEKTETLYQEAHC